VDRPFYTTRPNLQNECERWFLIGNPAHRGASIRHEHVTMNATQSAYLYIRSMEIIQISDFLGGDHSAKAKSELQKFVKPGNASRS
jgi:hypothetical protein